MVLLIIGMVLFIGIHCSNLFVPQLRAQFVSSHSELAWKGVYSLVSIAGLVLIVLGYGEARMQPTWLYHPPMGLRHGAALLSLIAMIFLAAYAIKGNLIKAKVGHPMYIAVKTWALAHLLANGTVADSILFGGFLVWAVVGFIINRRRDRANGVQAPDGTVAMTVATVLAGILMTGLFVMFLHQILIGVKPFG